MFTHDTFNSGMQFSTLLPLKVKNSKKIQWKKISLSGLGMDIRTAK